MRNIAVLLNSGFGDLVLLTTLFEAIKKEHGKTKCCLLYTSDAADE